MKSRWVLALVLLIIFGLSVLQINEFRKVDDDTSTEEVLGSSTPATLEDRLLALESRVYMLEKNTGLVKPKYGPKKEQFKQLSGGTVTGSEWQKMLGTDFTFDASLYGGSVEVSWQGWIENGYGGVRIFDLTNNRVVDGSEMTINSGVRSSFYSKTLSIWRGQNQYYIEGKNPLGELTLSSPRLKIVTR